MLRTNGELVKIKYHPLTPPETQAIVDEILSQTIIQSSTSVISELDVAYSLEGIDLETAKLSANKPDKFERSLILENS